MLSLLLILSAGRGRYQGSLEGLQDQAGQGSNHLIKDTKIRMLTTKMGCGTINQLGLREERKRKRRIEQVYIYYSLF